MPRVAKSNPSAAPVGVISKVLMILEALQGSSAGLGLKAICDITGIHKSTAHRFLKHLERERYLIRTEGGAYLIGPRLSQMSARGNQGATLQAGALAAFLPPEVRDNVLSTITFQQATSKTIMNLLQFRQDLEKIRRQGFAVDDEEAVQGARCVSAPILNSDREPIAAVSVSGPVTRVSPDQVGVLAEAVCDAARSISVAMGFPQPDHKALRPTRGKKIASA